MSLEHGVGGTFRILRENGWVKVWRTPWGEEVVDPKTRWLGWVPTAGEFIAAWDGADAGGREDLRGALAFYPYELEAEIEAIVGHVGCGDRAMEVAMRAALFTATSELSEKQQRFGRGLAEYLEASGANQLVALESRFCRVLYNDGGFHLDVLISSRWEVPSAGELAALLPAQVTPETVVRYRAVELLRANRELLEPAAGAEPLPGRGGLGG